MWVSIKVHTVHITYNVHEKDVDKIFNKLKLITKRNQKQFLTVITTCRQSRVTQSI